jgi:hypothetical protein
MANSILRGARAFEARARQTMSGSWLAQGAAIAALDANVHG